MVRREIYVTVAFEVGLGRRGANKKMLSYTYLRTARTGLNLSGGAVMSHQRPLNRAMSLFAGTTAVPADPILGLVAAFLEDPSPTKVNLAQGAYRTEQGEPLLLDAVRKAEERVVARGGSKEYLGAQRALLHAFA